MIRGLIVEGIGCGGKTELISALKANLKVHGGCDVRELDHVGTNDQFGRYLKEYATGDGTLFHRAHVSEHVFGGILRNDAPFTPEELAALNALVTLRFVCVLAEPPSFEAFATRMRQRSVFRPPFTRAQFERVMQAFRDAFEAIPHVRYTSRSLAELEKARTQLLQLLVRST